MKPVRRLPSPLRWPRDEDDRNAASGAEERNSPPPRRRCAGSSRLETATPPQDAAEPGSDVVLPPLSPSGRGRLPNSERAAPPSRGWAPQRGPGAGSALPGAPRGDNRASPIPGSSGLPGAPRSGERASPVPGGLAVPGAASPIVHGSSSTPSVMRIGSAGRSPPVAASPEAGRPLDILGR